MEIPRDIKPFTTTVGLLMLSQTTSRLHQYWNNYLPGLAQAHRARNTPPYRTVLTDPDALDLFAINFHDEDGYTANLRAAYGPLTYTKHYVLQIMNQPTVLISRPLGNGPRRILVAHWVTFRTRFLYRMNMNQRIAWADDYYTPPTTASACLVSTASGIRTGMIYPHLEAEDHPEDAEEEAPAHDPEVHILNPGRYAILPDSKED